ncbi:MAG: hypothetical protein F6K14_12615 [Symploca sp. SIO2C1]|nr:hypothetical protein [Symploca sp. SIO2C1]
MDRHTPTFSDYQRIVDLAEGVGEAWGAGRAGEAEGTEGAGEVGRQRYIPN